MRRPRGLAIAAALLVATAGRAAHAGDDDTAIALNLGWGSAVGFGGWTLTQAFPGGFRAEAGAGGGVTGIQLSLMPKIAVGARRDRFVFGAGVSVAVPRSAAQGDGYPVWLNVDAVGYEHLFESGWAISFHAGFFLGLGGGRWCPFSFDGDRTCDRPGDHHDVRGVWGPQSRFQLAYWF